MVSNRFYWILLECLDTLSHDSRVIGRCALLSGYVLAANSKGTDGVFAQVVGETAPAILKIGIQIRSAVERILDCFSKTASFVVSCQFFQPTPEGGQDRRCFLQTICLPLLLRKAVFLAITFNFKELVAVDHALDSCIFRPNCAAQPAKLSIDSVGIEH